jgi:hypothetical protein
MPNIMGTIDEDALTLFIQTYTAALIWSSEPEGELWDASMLAEETVTKIDQDCRKFVFDAALPSSNYADAGHDFALTRNNHGAGFWDGDWVNGEVLTKISHTFGECGLYLGDDDKIYSS